VIDDLPLIQRERVGYQVLVDRQPGVGGPDQAAIGAENNRPPTTHKSFLNRRSWRSRQVGPGCDSTAASISRLPAAPAPTPALRAETIDSVSDCGLQNHADAI
jgi:hypothetical protein